MRAKAINPAIPHPTTATNNSAYHDGPRIGQLRSFFSAFGFGSAFAIRFDYAKSGRWIPS
jgi:hypothetical protein